MSAGILLDDIVRLAEDEGREGLNRWSGAFLLEIKIEDASRLTATKPSQEKSPSSRTTEAYPVDDLLELRRVRGASNVRVYPLLNDSVAGRRTGCLIKLGDPSAAVSKEHVKFTHEGGAWTLTDLGSRNGTFVDREPVGPNESRQLEPFSHLQLGDKRFVFLGADELHSLVAPIRSAGAIPLAALAAELESLGSRRFLLRHDSPHLLIDVGDKSRSEFHPQTAHPFVGGDKLVLGRSREAEIRVSGRAVSKVHASFRCEGGVWRVQDAGSSYGTQKNGVELKANESSKLVPWDSCTFGSQRVRGLYLDSRGLLEFLKEEYKPDT